MTSRIFAALLVLLVSASPTLAQPFPGMLFGSRTGTPYVGPGDLVSGWSEWFGLRAYSTAVAATGTQKAIKIRRASDNTDSDIVILTTGALDVATAGTFCAATTCTIRTWYDQSGNARDFAQAGFAPSLTLSCISALPCISWAGGQYITRASYTLAQPFTWSAVAERTGSFTAVSELWEQDGSAFTQFGYTASANQIRVYGGTVLSATVSDSAWHALQGVLNGGSSAVNVDNTVTSGAAGAGGLAASFTNYIGSGGAGTSSLTGKMTEIGIHPSAVSAGNQTALCHNQRLYWATPGAC